MPRTTPVLLAAVVSLLSPALAQDFRARISGQVADSTGAVISGAAIVVTSIERNISSQTTSNSTGRFVVQFLLPGRYTLTVEKPGFKKLVRAGIALDSADDVSLDLLRLQRDSRAHQFLESWLLHGQREIRTAHV